MSKVSEHQIESELHQLRPRKITWRSGRKAAVGLGCLQLFLLPFIVVGIGTFGYALNSTFVALFGRTVTGQVIERHYEDSDEGGGSWKVRYTYRVGDRVYRGTDDERGDAILNPGTIVPIRVAPWLPGRGSFAVPPGASVWSECGFFWFFTLFWNGILSVIFYAIFVAPVIHRSLFTRGEVTIGTVVGKSVQQGQNTTYQLEYEYVPMAASLGNLPIQTGKDSVTKEEWDSVQIGERVTVLYQAGKPRYSALYRFGSYQVCDR